jgi:hypothetical protein
VIIPNTYQSFLGKSRVHKFLSSFSQLASPYIDKTEFTFMNCGYVNWVSFETDPAG